MGMARSSPRCSLEGVEKLQLRVGTQVTPLSSRRIEHGQWALSPDEPLPSGTVSLIGDERVAATWEVVSGAPEPPRWSDTPSVDSVEQGLICPEGPFVVLNTPLKGDRHTPIVEVTFVGPDDRPQTRRFLVEDGQVLLSR
ncbi:MAG: hypothetical protein ACI8RZ_005455 [Myxococcota bacterium]|jgi:hypothetical protein